MLKKIGNMWENVHNLKWWEFQFLVRTGTLQLVEDQQLIRLCISGNDPLLPP